MQITKDAKKWDLSQMKNYRNSIVAGGKCEIKAVLDESSWKFNQEIPIDWKVQTSFDLDRGHSTRDFFKPYCYVRIGNFIFQHDKNKKFKAFGFLMFISKVVSESIKSEVVSDPVYQLKVKNNLPDL